MRIGTRCTYIETRFSTGNVLFSYRYVLKQPVVQQEMDEAAFAIVHNKSFPGVKTLNPGAVFVALMPDPVYEFKMTGVRITYNGISPCTFKSCTRRWVETPTTSRRERSRDDAADGCAARPTCKRETTLSVTAFRKPSVETGDNGAGRPETETVGDERRGDATDSNDAAAAAAAAGHDWCRFSDETSAGRERAPDGSGACENPPRCSGNRSSHVHREDDRLANVIVEPPAGRTRRTSTGRDGRKAADTGAVHRSCSRRRSRGRKRADSSSDADGCGPRKRDLTTADHNGSRSRENRCPSRVRLSEPDRPATSPPRPADRRGRCRTSKCDAGDRRPVHGRDGRAEDVCAGFDGNEESRCTRFAAECESRDRVEDASVPAVDYETSYSSDGRD